MIDFKQFSPQVQTKAVELADSYAQLTEAEGGQDKIITAMIEGFNQLGELPGRIGDLHRKCAEREHELATLIAGELRTGLTAGGA